jgi:hypothetical protein
MSEKRYMLLTQAIDKRAHKNELSIYGQKQSFTHVLFILIHCLRHDFSFGLLIYSRM